jgi:UDPglucose 6-dehydrogenase
MKIAVIGTGYVGLVTGVCLANAGHTVTCIDIDTVKVSKMLAGEIPIYEPGLSELFLKARGERTLHITADMQTGVDDADVIFLALPTPPQQDGSADVSALISVAKQLGPLLKKYTVIVTKSTVPVGTADIVTKHIKTEVTFAVISNPEFLREGFAVHDFMNPDRIVIGSDSNRASRVMNKLYSAIVSDDRIIHMDVRSAEMTKYAANSFLAMKVTFMNEIANLAEKLGANVDQIKRGIGSDDRIGNRFLNAGIGFGGSCFPKDVQALQYTANQHGYDFKLLSSIVTVNSLQKQRIVEKVLRYFNDDIRGKHFAIWGLAFKPDTDDIRDAPALEIISSLIKLGARITAYDPHAADNTRHYFGEHKKITYADSAIVAAQGADALVIATEWQAFKEVDLGALHAALQSAVVFDGRNLFEPLEMLQHGFHYESIGRPLV